ncbi:MAG: translation initiation factor [Cyclobacteriaceae bacterium]
MGRKNKRNQSGIVYSTNPDYSYESDEPNQEETLPLGEQKLRVWRESKGGGKRVTVVRDFVGSDDDLKDLGKKLKSHCGVGGSTKEREILIQGDQRDKVVAYLQKQGYAAKPAGG